MFIQTHGKISEAIINTLAADGAPTICRASFQWGCKLTDIFWTSPDHTKAESFFFLSALIKELQQSQSVYANPQDRHRFFIKLGIVCHYICDYFCKAHNDPYYNSLLPHLIYESKLQTEFKAHNLAKICKLAKNNKYSSLGSIQMPLPDYIQSRHLAYLSEKPSMKKDVFFAVDTSTSVVAALLHQTQMGYRHKAA